jgi:putative PIN family toxin of toxin-antitoxin system
MIAVIDANIWISSFISQHGPPGRIADYWRSGFFTAVISSAILGEIRRGLTYPRIQSVIRRSAAEIEAVLADLTLISVSVPPGSVRLSRDPDDDRILEAALAGAADYIVTGDRDLLDLDEFEGIPIIAPARFLAILETSDFQSP